MYFKNTPGQEVICSVTLLDGTRKTDGTVTVYWTANGNQAQGSTGSGVATHIGKGEWAYTIAEVETYVENANFVFEADTGECYTVPVVFFPTYMAVDVARMNGAELKGDGSLGNEIRTVNAPY